MGTKLSPGFVAFATVLALAAGAYGPTVGNGYVWDDVPLIVQNTIFDGPFNIRTALFADLWAGASIGEEPASGYFRPLMVASLWVDHGLGGGPAWAHLHSLLWHLAAVVAAYRLGQVVGTEFTAWVGAVVVALHPLQTEAVMWVAARNDLMAAVFGLITLRLFLLPQPRPFWTVVCTVLAALSKESVFLLPIAGGLLWWARPERGGRQDLLRRLAPMLVGLMTVVGLRLVMGVGAARGPTSHGLQLVLTSLPSLLGWLGWKLAWPWPLSTGYALEYLDRLSLSGRLAGATGLTVAMAWTVWNGSRVARVGVCWFAIFLAPVVWALATTGWMGERYLYVSMLGLGWTLGAVLEGNVIHARRAVGLVAVVWALLVGMRTGQWASDLQLWTSAYEASPSPFTSESLGHAVRGSGGPERALPYFVGALDDARPLSTSCVPLMRAAVGTQKLVRAVQLAHWAAEQGCSGPEFHGWWAVALAGTGRWHRLSELLAGTDASNLDGRLQLAKAALTLQRGDIAAFAELEVRWKGDEVLRPLAEALIENSRRHPEVVTR